MATVKDIAGFLIDLNLTQSNTCEHMNSFGATPTTVTSISLYLYSAGVSLFIKS